MAEEEDDELEEVEPLTRRREKLSGKETARVRTLGTVKEIARVRTHGLKIRSRKKVKKRKSEAQKKSLVDKAERTVCEFLRVGMERRRSGEKAEREIRVPGRNNFWEDLEDGSSFS